MQKPACMKVMHGCCRISVSCIFLYCLVEFTSQLMFNYHMAQNFCGWKFSWSSPNFVIHYDFTVSSLVLKVAIMKFSWFLCNLQNYNKYLTSKILYSLTPDFCGQIVLYDLVDYTEIVKISLLAWHLMNNNIRQYCV